MAIRMLPQDLVFADEKRPGHQQGIANGPTNAVTFERGLQTLYEDAWTKEL